MCSSSDLKQYMLFAPVINRILDKAATFDSANFTVMVGFHFDEKRSQGKCCNIIGQQYSKQMIVKDR